MQYLAALILLSMFFMSSEPGKAAAEDYAAEREEMIKQVELMARESGPYTGRHVLDDRVMQAMAKVPRHMFVPPEMRSQAYQNRALPIGHDQTISQPYIVALMSDLAQVQPGEKVLEVGTGSGYQAAILAEVGAEVYTIEIVPELGREAAQTLQKLGYDNLHLRIGNGYKGWPEAAPFDAIVITAAPDEIPQALVDQLAADGRMIVPVGARAGMQTLTVVEKTAEGGTKTREVVPVSFVPMVKEPE